MRELHGGLSGGGCGAGSFRSLRLVEAAMGFWFLGAGVSFSAVEGGFGMRGFGLLRRNAGTSFLKKVCWALAWKCFAAGLAPGYRRRL